MEPNPLQTGLGDLQEQGRGRRKCHAVRPAVFQKNARTLLDLAVGVLGSDGQPDALRRTFPTSRSVRGGHRAQEGIGPYAGEPPLPGS